MNIGPISTVYVLLAALALTASGCQTTNPAGALQSFGFPAPSTTAGTSSGGKVAGGAAGCAAGGAAGWLGANALKGFLRDQGYSNSEIQQAGIAVAGLGCIIGGATAVNIIKNMDEKSKKAQEEAWETAVAQTETQGAVSPKVAWKTATYEGETQYMNPEILSNGTKCATRRNYVQSAAGGTAEQFIYVCQDDSGIYRPVEA